MITTHRYRPQRLILFAMATVVLLASQVAVAQVHTMPIQSVPIHTMPAHPSSHGGSFAYGSPAMPGGCTACGTAMVAGPNGYGCPKCMMGVDCATACGSEARWQDMRPMRFDAYGPGGYAGPSRMQHLAKYHIRPGDEIQIVYLVTRRQDNGQYRLMPGDEVSIESIADEDLDRGTLQYGLLIQPDGTITVRLLGQIQAAGLTVEGLRTLLEREYEAFYDDPAIDAVSLLLRR
ncbi:MAG: polysaccharide biosynthesis/export family protein, partial [Rhodopirellula sp. JB053]